MQNMNQHFFTVAIVAAIVYALIWLPKQTSFIRSIAKTFPVVLLAIGAIQFDAPPILSIALILSAAGDAFLSRDGEKYFLLGLGSFLMAHIAFIALFLTHPSKLIHSQTTLILITILSIVLILLVLKNLWSQLGPMKTPVVIYTLIIAAMNVAAWVTAQPTILLVGVTSFIISDTILAHTLFYWQNTKTKLIGSYALWITYIAAQVMIVFSFTS